MIPICFYYKMKEREFVEFAKGQPVVTAKQIAALIGDAAYAKLYIHRMLSRGVVRRLAKGIYTAHGDPAVYASHVRYPSYISLWFAFQYHGATTQMPKTVEVMARKAGSVDGVEFIRTKHFWGYGPTRYSGFQILIADLEKAIVDAVMTRRIPNDDIAAALEKCDRDRLEAYALRVDVSTAKRIGYVAETGGVFLARLHERVAGDRNYAHLGEPVAGNRWKVIE